MAVRATHIEASFAIVRAGTTLLRERARRSRPSASSTEISAMVAAHFEQSRHLDGRDALLRNKKASRRKKDLVDVALLEDSDE